MPVRDLLSAASGVGGASDPDFYYNTLLLNGDGTNGAQNNTFIDSSTNNFTITRYGNTTQGSFSPYGDLWSNYINGNTSNLLYLNGGTPLTFGTSDFTVEFWVNFSVAGTQVILYDSRDGGGSSVTPVIYKTTGNTINYFVNGSVVITGSQTISAGIWTHIAVSRSSSSTKLFINGVQDGSTYSDSNNYTLYTNRPVIGADGNNGSFNSNLNGYISNLRALKGTGLYTTTFTPPTTPLTAITNTVLLTCQSNRFVDNSSNNATIIPAGSPSVQRFSPFNPTAPYSTSVIGGSGYFDGSGDYLTLANDAAFQFGSGEFTIDGWFYSTSSGDQAVMSRWSSPDSNSAWEIIRVSGTTYFQVASSSSAISVTTSDFPLNQWNHFAMSKSSTTMAVWLNGTRIGTNTVSGSVNNGDQGLSIGVRSGGTSYPFAGYLANLRVVKGTDVYGVSNTTITVPTAPTTAITNTSFLGNMTNAGIPDLAMQNNLETVGNAQVSTSVKKYGTGSISFNGTTDYLTTPSSVVYGIGLGSYTIECWVYTAGSGAGQSVVDCRTTGTQYAPTIILDSSTNVPYVYLNGSTVITGGSGLSTNTWTHLALCRDGTSLRLFVNGTQTGSTYTDSGTYVSSMPVNLGTYVPSPANNYFVGYIDDFRFTNGIARYTANFTPPIAALPTF
jgi:hypothetical protein